MNKIISLLFVILIFFIPLYASVATQKDQAVIGVLSFRSKNDTFREWEPLAQYLHKQIPSYHFIIRPLTYKEFNTAAAANELDFAFTNPEHYIYLSAKYDLSRMATLIRANVDGKVLTEFGGVIIARSDQKGINNLNDIRGKNVAAVDELSLGGYLAQSVLLRENNIDVRGETHLQFTDMPHDKVIYLVESGAADVGFIRTGVLEKMVKEGKINRDDFKIIHPVSNGFPQALSTALFPEWPFAAAKKTDRVLANKVGVALLNLPHGSEVAKTAGYHGWNIPLSYEGIRSMMQKLRVKPYDVAPLFSVIDAVRQYALMLVSILVFVLLSLSFLMWRLRQNALLLKEKSDGLEHHILLVRKAEQYLKRSASVFHNSREGIVITDSNQVIIDVNEAFCELTGYEKEEVIGKKPMILRSGLHEPDFYNQMDEAIHTEGSWRGEIWNKKKNGEKYAEFLRIDSVRDANGKIDNYIGIFSDITDYKIRQEQLHYRANYDPLTNLPNRYLYMKLAEQMLAITKRNGSKAIIAFLDLDGFKQVNDHYGHEIGDRLLKKVAKKLQDQLRESDTVARIGGDEFIILLSDVAAVEDGHPLLKRILESLKEPFEINGIRITIGASIGVALYPDNGEDVEILVRYADAAMYDSKEKGKNRITYFEIGKITLPMYND